MHIHVHVPYMTSTYNQPTCRCRCTCIYSISCLHVRVHCRVLCTWLNMYMAGTEIMYHGSFTVTMPTPITSHGDCMRNAPTCIYMCIYILYHASQSAEGRPMDLTYMCVFVGTCTLHTYVHVHGVYSTSVHTWQVEPQSFQR